MAKERVKKCHNSRTTQRHEGTKKKAADFRSERPDTKVIQQPAAAGESTDLGQGAGRPRFIPGHITLLFFLVSLCLCVELVDFFTPSVTLGYIMAALTGLAGAHTDTLAYL